MCAAQTHWMSQAKCKGVPQYFFPTHNEKPGAAKARELEAKKICADCPVRIECRDFGRSNGECGIWGGETEEERYLSGFPSYDPAMKRRIKRITDRRGESLWSLWFGDLSRLGFERDTFYTVGHVDIEHEVVRRALASTIQREGIADTLGEAYRRLDTAEFAHVLGGIVDEDCEYTVCNESGETFYGDTVNSIVQLTLVEI